MRGLNLEYESIVAHISFQFPVKMVKLILPLYFACDMTNSHTLKSKIIIVVWVHNEPLGFMYLNTEFPAGVWLWKTGELLVGCTFGRVQTGWKKWFSWVGDRP